MYTQGRNSLIYLVFGGLCLSTAFAACPWGWVSKNRLGRCYRFVRDTSLDWNEARQACLDQHGDLLSIRSKNEKNFIMTRVRQYQKESDTPLKWWTGLNSRLNSSWSWSDGNRLDSKHVKWAPGEPANRTGAEVCASITTDGFTTHRCTTFISYICARPKGVPAACPAGYLHIKNECYKKYLTPMGWDAGRRVCQRDGADLMVVNDRDDQQTVNGLTALAPGKKTWIGLEATGFAKGAATWTWVNDTTPAVYFWGKGEPNVRGNTWNGTAVASLHSTDTNKGWEAWEAVPKDNENLPICRKPEGTCEPGWRIFRNKCFLVSVNLQLSWNEASKYCSSRGSKLLILRNAVESNFIASSVLPGLNKGGTRSVWLGATDAVTKNWRWVDGSNMTYTRWKKDEPASDPQKDSMAFIRTGNFQGRWSTTTNFLQPKAFICVAGAGDPIIEPTEPPVQFKCDRGWTLYGSSCFQFYDTEQDWVTARKTCRDEQADLITIVSIKENEFVTKMIRNSNHWIGLNRRSNVDSKFVWLDTEMQALWNNWAPGKPSADHQENCVMITGRRGQNLGTWINKNCNQKMNFICSKSADPSSTTTPSSITTPPWTQKCGPFWEDDGVSDYCYQFRKDLLNWYDARSTCRSGGGDLVSITSIQENQYIVGRLKTLAGAQVWTGANDLDNKKGFKWSDGSPFRFINWAPGEPNDVDGSENCVEIMFGNFQWNDVHCNNRFQYICKKRGNVPDTTVVPTTVKVSPGWRFGCKPGYAWYKKWCYKFVKASVNWRTAVDRCRREGSELASIWDNAENSFLVTRAKKVFKTAVKTGTTIWTGLSDLRLKHTFEWIDGSEVTFTNWDKGEPNNFENREDCVNMYIEGSTRDGTWNDAVCNTDAPDAILGYVCKSGREALPPTSMPPTVSGCPNDFDSANEGSCYKFVSTRKTWQAAENNCKGMGGFLVHVGDSWEQAFLTSEISGRNGDWWIGLSNKDSPAGRYTWSNGRKVAYTNWNRDHTGNERKACVTMLTTNRLLGLWSDQQCGTTFPYICEKERTGYSTTPIPTTQAPPTCPSLWRDFGDQCYKQYYTYTKSMRKTWTEARDFCRGMGADLASIHSSSEQDMLSQLIRYNREIWIGLNKRDTDQDHQWSDGSAFDYTNWDKDEPNTHNNQELCAELGPNNKKWGYRNCAIVKNHICQIKRGKPLVTVTPTPSVTPAPSCGGGWLYHGGNCYFLSQTYGKDSKKNWFDARQWCQINGGELASIHSEDEHAFLTSQVTQRTDHSLWIGLNELALDGYKWSDGSPANFFRWSQGEPNDDNGGQRCVDMYIWNGFWNDANCGDSRSFICKRSNSSTGTVTLPTRTPAPGYCIKNYVGVGDKCFEVFDDMTIDFDSAARRCRRKGGRQYDLASITDEAELSLIAALLFNKSMNYWIGLNSRQARNLWRWVDNSPVTLTNWASGQPGGGWRNPKEECVEVVTNQGANNIGKWNAIPCSSKRAYICEQLKDGSISTPQPTVKTSCKSGYFPFGNACYMLNTNPLTWTDAKHFCQRDGGDLVSVQTYPENAYIHIVGRTLTGEVWIGLSDIDTTGVYSWSDGWPVRYTNWGKDEPSKGPTDGCVTIMEDGRWNDTMCEKRLPSICRITTENPPPTPPSVPGYCPSDDWVPYGKFCYLIKAVRPTSVSWGSANTECVVRGGVLASVLNKEENDFIFSQMNNQDGVRVNAWLGMIKRGKGGSYGWYDGSPVAYTNWAPGEPNDKNGNDNCVEMFERTGDWNDHGCSVRQGYICKAKKVPLTLSPPTKPSTLPSLPTTTTAPPPGTCPPGWVRFEMTCYDIKTYPVKTWGEAHLQCLQENAELVSIESQAENNFLFDNFPRTYRNIWIGFIKNGLDQPFYWFGGTPVTFINWADGEPNDKDGTENCVEMLRTNGKWNDMPCSQNMGYICEKAVDLGNATIPSTSPSTIMPSTAKSTNSGQSSSKRPTWVPPIRTTPRRTQPPPTTQENNVEPPQRQTGVPVGPGGVAAIVIGTLALLVVAVIVVLIVVQKKGKTPLLQGFPSFANPMYSKHDDNVQMASGNNFENPMYGETSTA